MKFVKSHKIINSLIFKLDKDLSRYTKNYPENRRSMIYFLFRGENIAGMQLNVPWCERDHSYIDYFRKAYEKEDNPHHKNRLFNQLRLAESKRDFHTGSLRQINNLIQIGPPNLELKEARCEIYKISISFQPKCKSF